ncbi:MAG: DUF6029 family protein [Edaphocola sp.]
MRKFLLSFLGVLTLGSAATKVSAQGAGNLSGDLMMNGNFFQRDSVIGAETDLYKKYLSGSEGWLTLRYSNYGFNGYLRLDVFNNSNLKTPTQAMSGFGIGAWSISKEIKGLTITGGYIYDQIGSGVLFRSYEDRGLLIDNALKGLHLKYRLDKHVTLKAFTGQSKNVFESYNPVIRGFNAEGDYDLGKKVHITPGAGVVNRTLDQESYTQIYNTISAYNSDKQFTPRYNMYAFSLYNTLSAGDFTWFFEGAYKTHEATFDSAAISLVDKPGNVFYTTLSWARKGIAINLTGKRTDHFSMRTSPFNGSANSGMVDWQPIVAQIRPQRLIARYTPAAQEVSELAGYANVLFSPTDNYDFTLSYTHINTIESSKLYREAYLEANIRSVKNFLIDIGAQYMEYNKEYYYGKIGLPVIKAFTPFTEITYLINSKSSIHLQGQYMHTKQDDGSWAFLGLEYAIAPKWSFAVSDMLNVAPTEHSVYKNQHFYNVFIARTQGAHRISLAYVKQVEGINCSGGVCRYEPAFSGLKVMITSSF